MSIAKNNTIYEPLCSISAVPAALLRTFKREDHAREFLAGNIRFGHLQYYRTMEDCRGDETEGRASIRWDLESDNPNLHNVTYTGTSLSPYYVLCTSHSGVCTKHLAKFGSFVVEIHQPMKLLERICDAWSDDSRSSSDAFITPVLYNKNGLVSPPPYFIAPPSLVYAQKPISYSDEAEFRYVLCCKVGTMEDPFITLSLGPCQDICNVISLP